MFTHTKCENKEKEINILSVVTQKFVVVNIHKRSVCVSHIGVHVWDEEFLSIIKR